MAVRAKWLLGLILSLAVVFLSGGLASAQPADLLTNGDVELDVDGNGLGDCWQRAGYGTNDRDFTRYQHPSTGSWVEEVTLANRVSGNAKIITRQQGTDCSPAVDPTHDYEFSAEYISTTEVRPVAYFQRAAGTWHYWTYGPGSPASAGWTTHTWQLPPLPTDAVRISVGLTITLDGTLTVDNHSFIDLSGQAPPDTTPPTITIDTPTNGATLTGPATIAATATDNDTVTAVDFLIDGAVIDTDTTTPYATTVDTTTHPDGTTTIEARAHDPAGNTTTATITTTIDNQTPPPPPPPSLITNAGHEDDLDGNGEADCWQRATSSGVTATFQHVLDPQTGSWVEEATVTARTSGTAKIITRQQSTGCSTAVSGGGLYTYAADYRSDVPVRPVAYYQRAAGTWHYWTYGVTSPASGTWTTTLTWQLPPLPADAVRLSIGLTIAGIGTYAVDNHVLADVTPPPGGTTTVSITFDDAKANQMQAADVLTQYGLNGTFYVNEGRIDVSSTAMTSAQLVALDAAGHEIGGHTLNHTRLSTVDYDEARRVVCTDRNNLIARGFQVTSFAYPYGATSSEALAAVEDCGYNSGRDVGGVSPTQAVGESIPPASPYQMISVRSMRATDTVADMQQYVLDAEAAGGSWVQVIFHDICSGCSTQGVSIEDFETFVAWLAARETSGTVVRTIDQVVGGPVSPPVDPPPAPPEGSGNLLNNNDLESEHPYIADSPECWARVASGGTVTSFVRTTDAYSGSFAEEITLSSSPGSGYSARIESRRDQGGCAPTVTGGDQYEVSAWYKSDTNVRLLVAYRDSTGSWFTHATSPELGPASDWTQMTFVPPPLPTDAVAISLRFEVRAEGTAVVDDLVAQALSP